jgi:two-component SAPR family response regulator
MTVINIDDDSEDGEFFKDAINDINPAIKSFYFRNCDDAMRLIGEEVLPDFIFIDINMPTTNGIECMQRITNIQRFSKVKIVMFSTSANPSQQMEFDRLGVQYLKKPTEYKSLINALQKIILGE